MEPSTAPALPTAAKLLPWPLPALAAWAAAWVLYTVAVQLGAGVVAAWVLGLALSVALAMPVRRRWRQLIVAGGFALSSLLGGAALPSWLWALAGVGLLMLYPVRAWRDAPVFPTPPDALLDLRTALPLPAGSRVLDAGCGLGHGLRALRRAWPDARLEGVEWSAPIAAWCALRCRFARVRRGDLWRDDWSPYAAVYLFQRPESMARAWSKACAEMPAGHWLVSLEFAVPGVAPDRRLDAGGGRPLWLYRTPQPSIPTLPGR